MVKGDEQSLEDADEVALRLLTAEFLISCEKLPPCWYRINSRENNMLPDNKSKAWLPSVGDIFGMTDQRANDLLLACGLIKRRGKKLETSVDSLTALRSEYAL
jgi:hypothetical protein